MLENKQHWLEDAGGYLILLYSLHLSNYTLTLLIICL